MALTTILEAVKTAVETVAGIGPVMVYSRYTPSEKELTDTFSSAGVLRPWLITRESTASKDMGPQWSRDTHTVVLHGYRAVTSAAGSEQSLQDEAEAVRAKLRDETVRLLGGAGRIITPCSCRVFNAVMFANQILAWHAELVIQAEERIAP